MLVHKTGISIGDVSVPSPQSPSCGRRRQEEDAQSQDPYVSCGSNDVPLPYQSRAEAGCSISLQFSLPPSFLIESCSFPLALPSQLCHSSPLPGHEVPWGPFPSPVLSAWVAALLRNLTLYNTPLVPPFRFLPSPDIPFSSQLAPFMLFPPAG